ncbi:MAG: hypothetical protein IJM15_02395 [Erysipelotrichaceae bacterium]|nr:hypothetical protein [Erysipelotrichaceae bacterium]
MVNKTKASSLQGLFIHHDDHNRTIYYDFITSKGYQMDNESAKWYVIYSSIIPLYFAVIYFCYDLFGLPLITSLLIGIGMFVASFLIFRFTVLYKLPVANGFKPEGGGNIINAMARRYSNTNLILLIALLLPLTIITPL